MPRTSSKGPEIIRSMRRASENLRSFLHALLAQSRPLSSPHLFNGPLSQQPLSLERLALRSRSTAIYSRRISENLQARRAKRENHKSRRPHSARRTSQSLAANPSTTGTQSSSVQSGELSS